jgi:hypothetical protein
LTRIDEKMTTKMTKAVTVGALVATLAIMLAYSALILPATAAQAPSSTTATTTGTSSATSSTSAATTMNAPPGPGGGPGGVIIIQGGQVRGGPGSGPFGGRAQYQAEQVNMTVGQKITITSTKGEYVAIANHDDNGTASGTLTFTVSGKLAGGYTLSITSGSIVVNGTTYTVSSGSAQMDRSASQLEGQGTTSSSGAFIVTATAHGSFAGTTATMSLDLTNGSTEYLVALSGSI